MDIKALLDQKQNRKVEEVQIPGTEIRIRVQYLLPLDHDRIVKRKDLYKKVGGRMDMRLYREAVMLETVKGWNGITMDEQPYPFTPDNVRELDQLFAPFREVWMKASGLAKELENEDEEDDESGN